MLSLLDIQKKEFKNSLKGYNPKEVDLFLDEIVETLEHYIDELDDVKDGLISVTRDNEKYKEVESALSDTLIFAKKTSEEIIANARHAADEMISNAKKEAELIVDEANLRALDIKKKSEIELDDLQKRKYAAQNELQSFKTRVESILRGQLTIVEGIDVEI